MSHHRRRAAAGLCATAAALSAALTVAAPASAIVPPADGVYAYHEAGILPATWTFASVCIQANGTRAQPDYSDETIQTLGCTLNLTSVPDDYVADPRKIMEFGGASKLVSDRWTFQLIKPEGMVCPDGSKAPTTDTYALDQVTMTGTHKIINAAQCGVPAGMTSVPFSLSFVGPLDAPVERFPDNCNYLGGRPSICS